MTKTDFHDSNEFLKRCAPERPALPIPQLPCSRLGTTTVLAASGRNRTAGDDRDPNTNPNPNWLPLPTKTAPDPSYPGAHGTISFAGAEVLRFYFGDQFAFDVTSESLQGVKRHFTSFSGAARGRFSQVCVQVPAYEAVVCRGLPYSVLRYREAVRVVAEIGPAPSCQLEPGPAGQAPVCVLVGSTVITPSLKAKIDFIPTDTYRSNSVELEVKLLNAAGVKYFWRMTGATGRKKNNCSCSTGHVIHYIVLGLNSPHHMLLSC